MLMFAVVVERMWWLWCSRRRTMIGFVGLVVVVCLTLPLRLLSVLWLSMWIREMMMVWRF